MWAVMAAIPDVEEYFAIFDDYLDFDIKPWDDHGYDQGEMIPERKVALRYLSLAMNIHKTDPALLPTNFLSFMSEYQKPEFKEPDNLPANVKRWRQQRRASDKRYSDLRSEVVVSTSPDKNQTGSSSTNKPPMTQQNQTGLSRKSLEGFNWNVRKGSSTSDVIEKTDIIPKGPNRYIQTTTRSVFWDVPDEDSIHKETWDVSRYTSPEDMARINKKGPKGGAK